MESDVLIALIGLAGLVTVAGLNVWAQVRTHRAVKTIDIKADEAAAKAVESAESTEKNLRTANGITLAQTVESTEKRVKKIEGTVDNIGQAVIEHSQDEIRHLEGSEQEE